MRRRSTRFTGLLAAAMLTATVTALPAQDLQPSDEPLPTSTIEEEEVRLVVLDVVVVDGQGNTVADLTAGDFEIIVDGGSRPPDTLDVDCAGGSTPEPKAVRHASKREVPWFDGRSRKIVLALDYLHLAHTMRTEVLERTREVVKHGVAPGDEIMVVALNGGLRIEQHFTADPEEVLAALNRMEYDITLWQPDYFHLHESVFVEPLVALLDILGQVPGNKAVVLYSTMQDVPLDLEFDRIAAIAATSRCSIYPVDAAGLRTLLGGPAVPG